MKREARTGPAPVRRLFLIAGAVAASAAAPVFFPAAAEAREASVPRDQGIEDFYEARDDRPLWLQGQQPSAAARQLLTLLRSAEVDGLDPESYRIDQLDRLLSKAAEGSRGAARKADYLISKAFVAYASDLRNARSQEIQYIDPQLHTGAPSPRVLLDMAAKAPSLGAFVEQMGWMNPDYAPLRKALVSGTYDNDRQRDLLRINLQRARTLPAGYPRYVIVNAAAQRLYMYENGRLADSMRVVVGQQKDDRMTPMMAGYLRYAAMNPYWNVPPDLVWDDVGIFVEKFGLGYLQSRGYQILSDWTEDATPIDPATVNWQAVKDGIVKLRVRQLPGHENFLGTIKYMFTNPFGVYLHDTPKKELLKEKTRLFSGGCIRLEDAARFGRWLFGRTLTPNSDAPEIEVPLDQPVPVYVTYLTAVPDGSSITYLDDVYGWDAKRIASMGSSSGRAAAR